MVCLFGFVCFDVFLRTRKAKFCAEFSGSGRYIASGSVL